RTDTGEVRSTEPLLGDARALASSLRDDGCEVVLLGSVATGKYVELLEQVFGTRLLFPSAFVGRGDMSRGGLLLRSARDRRELEYVPVAGAVPRGPRPPPVGARRGRGGRRAVAWRGGARPPPSVFAHPP